jgi:Phage integrase, N-terminal SAM-like domain
MYQKAKMQRSSTYLPDQNSIVDLPPLGRIEHYPEKIQKILAGFSSYLVVRRDRAASTVDAYRHDSIQFIEFYRAYYDETLENFTITPDAFIEYSDMLKRNGDIRRSTIKRRLIGTHRFWGYLYRERLVSYSPISMDEMDIVVKKIINPTRPVGPERFTKLRKAARHGLRTIY